jgi:UDP-2,4-diacetamido-2,4,6-trideoxy-beta-L-altropyranose hydrolase
MKKRVVFRADGDAEIGYGHFIRTLGIAGLINDVFDCVYATQQPTEYQLNEIHKVCSGVIELSKNENSFDEFLNHLRKGDIVVLDNYFFDSDYQLLIKAKGCKVVYIDDYNDRNYVCDALINNVPGFPAATFIKQDYTKLYLGTDYALLRKEFFNPELRQIKKKENTIFISFGGGDFLNLSDKIIGFLNQINPDFEIHLLIGDAYKFGDSLKKYNNITAHKNISAAEVALLIANCSICIIPASSLLNEASSIGSLVLLGYFTDNQIQPYDYFIANDLAIGLGDYRTLDFEFFKDKFNQLAQSGFLIHNQRKAYHYQQADNLKNIFYEI